MRVSAGPIYIKTISKNPCQQNNGGCSDYCVIDGCEAVCTCYDGKLLMHDGKTCKPIIETLFSSGIIFGWSSMSYVLVRLGYFNSSCDGIRTSNKTINGMCPKQQENLQLVFTVAIAASCISNLGIGYILDKFGTWVIRTIGVGLFLVGFLVTALTTNEQSFILYITMPIIACAGFTVLVTNIPVGNLAGDARAVIITVVNGAFESSAVIFVLVKIVFDNGIAFDTILYFMASCTLLILLRTFFLMPKMHIPYKVNVNTFQYGISDCSTKGNTRRDSEEMILPKPIKRNSLKLIVCSRTFWLNIFYVGIVQLRNQFFFGSLDPWLRSIPAHVNDTRQSRYINAFGIIQLGGIVFAPLNGLLINSVRKYVQSRDSPQNVDQKSIAASMALTSLIATIFSILVLIPIMPLQYLSFVLQTMFRSFLYGSLSSFLIICYPNEHFGKLYGITLLVAVLISLLQFPLFNIVMHYFNGNFFVINIVLLFACVVTLIHPILLFVRPMQQGDSEKLMN